jgi:hypothetical protein
VNKNTPCPTRYFSGWWRGVSSIVRILGNSRNGNTTILLTVTVDVLDTLL